MSSYIVDYSARAPFVADTVAALSVDRLAIATPEDDRIAFRDASSFKSMGDRGKEKKLHKPQTTAAWPRRLCLIFSRVLF